ncbi:MAG: pyridoxamine 5'-phosphate oxidase [Alphaproteobacteria bacterium]|jgi:pyridoxamine 5'-phosphate oxidase
MDASSIPDPIAQFQEWFAEAQAKESDLPEAMTLATVDDSGVPDARMVLLKDADDSGFVFYTNSESAKGQQLASNPFAALVFHWKSLKRQVRVRGRVEPVSADEADAYFSSRARGAQIGAWASDQSREMDSAYDLEKAVARFTARFGISAIPRPPHWNGYRVIPEAIEFWEERLFRLHKREHFRHDGNRWRVARLYP